MRTRRVARAGELLLAFLLFYSTAMHLKFADFAAGIVPAFIPWHLFWVYFTGAALCAAGLSIVTLKQTGLAATLLGVMLLLFVLLIHAPSMFQSIVDKPADIRVLWSFNRTGGLNNALKDIGLTLSAFILALEQSTAKGPMSKWALRVLTILLALVMVMFGAEHLFYTNYTPGIPSCSFVSFWIPMRLFWGYLTGAILLSAGVMIVTRRHERKAAVSLGLMIVVVAVSTYALRMLAHAGNYGELTNTMKDLGLGGAALFLTKAMPSGSVFSADAGDFAHQS